MAAMFLVLLFTVVGLIGLGMLGAGIFLLLQGSEGTRRVVGIILLILGLPLMCTLIAGGLFFFFSIRTY